MNKIQFFTLVRRDGEVKVEYVNGYTDGRFNYYKSSFGTWFAIEPSCGLSMSQASTRKEAAAKAYEAAAQIAGYTYTEKAFQQARARFEKALAAIGARRPVGNF